MKNQRIHNSFKPHQKYCKINLANSWQTVLTLVDPRRPLVVQFWAAKHLCDALSVRFEEIVEKEENVLRPFVYHKNETKNQ
jgi:hypothetical protein